MIPKYIIVHHTVSSRDNTTIRSINDWHKARDFTLSSLGFYIGYHYLILGSGEVVQTRRDNEMGCHILKQNDGKIGVCLTGNFDIETPTPVQLTSLQGVLEKLKLTYSISDDKILGHKELVSTACPGKELMKWLKLYRQLTFLQKKILELKAMIARLKH